MQLAFIFVVFSILVGLALAQGPQVFNKKIYYESYVSSRYAETTLTALLWNPSTTSDAAIDFWTYLPENAFIDGLRLKTGGRWYDGVVTTEREAAEIFRDIVAQNLTGAIVRETSGNTFAVSVNLEADATALIELSWSELLLRDLGVYHYELITAQSQEVEIDVYIEIDEPLGIDMASSGLIPSAAYYPLVNEARSANGRTLTYTYTGENIGVFKIDYSVNDPTLSESPVGTFYFENDHFVHFFSPSGAPALGKDIVFVLDTSGSMNGAGITQLKQAMNNILPMLRPGDYFNIVRYSSQPQRLWADMRAATTSAIAEATTFVDGFSASGGTAINAALLDAIALAESRSAVTGNTPLIYFLSDGYPSYNRAPNIVQNLNARNTRQVPIHTIALGFYFDRWLMENIALQSTGEYREFDLVDTREEMEHFYRGIADPQFLGVGVRYCDPVSNTYLRENVLSTSSFARLNGGSEIIVAGQFIPGYEPCFPLDTAPDTVTIEIATNRSNLNGVVRRVASGVPAERIYGFYLVKNLIQRYYEAQLLYQPTTALYNRAQEIAIQYQLVTDFTSIILEVDTSLQDDPTTSWNWEFWWPDFAQFTNGRPSTSPINEVGPLPPIPALPVLPAEATVAVTVPMMANATVGAPTDLNTVTAPPLPPTPAPAPSVAAGGSAGNPGASRQEWSNDWTGSTANARSALAALLLLAALF